MPCQKCVGMMLGLFWIVSSYATLSTHRDIISWPYPTVTLSVVPRATGKPWVAFVSAAVRRMVTSFYFMDFSLANSVNTLVPIFGPKIREVPNLQRSMGVSLPTHVRTIQHLGSYMNKRDRVVSFEVAEPHHLVELNTPLIR